MSVRHRWDIGGTVDRYAVSLLIGLVLAMPVWADGTPTGVEWPGWRVMTSELSTDPRYPITNMLDADPRTAWVFGKPWKTSAAAYVDPGETERSFAHGVGAYLLIATDSFPDNAGAFTVDGIGIVNGYAKDAATYRRNNRITRVTVLGGGTTADLEETASLQETLALQRISFAPVTVASLTVRIDAVNPGPDNDLCISELVLYSHGKALPWKITPVLLHNVSNDCGCGGGPWYQLITRDGRAIPLNGKRHSGFLGVARQPGTAHYLLCTQRGVVFYDMADRVFRLQRTLHGDCRQLGWVDNAHALVMAEDSNGMPHWYRLDANTYRWEAVTPPKRAPTFLPGAHQPNYGA